MAKLDQDLSDTETVMAAHQFLADLQDAMKGVAALLTPEEEQAVNAAIQQRSKSKPANVQVRDAVDWQATTKAPDDTAWNWPEADKRLRAWSGVDGDNPTAAQWAKYEQAFAWCDGKNNSLASFKLPHHDIIGGKICVVLKGVQAAMAALNGARGGTSIPSKDQDGVYQHLTKHYHQFGVTPPDQRSVTTSPLVERRVATFQLTSDKRFVGRAAVFNTFTTIHTPHGSFREQIRPGAFDNISQCNVVALFNHDDNMPLGSTDAGNVTLKQSADGLDFDIRALPTTLGKDMRVLVKNGVVRGCSFGFLHSTCQDEWNGNERTLTSIPDVCDVSLVLHPAYPTTNVNLRSVQQFNQNDLWKYSLALRKLRMEHSISE